jgi:hypothetical protein
VGVVDLAVLGVEHDLEHLLLLGRQLGGHLLLGAPAHQRPDAPAQRGQHLGVAAALDRDPVVLGEPLRAREQPRRDDREH